MSMIDEFIDGGLSIISNFRCLLCENLFKIVKIYIKINILIFKQTIEKMSGSRKWYSVIWQNQMLINSETFKLYPYYYNIFYMNALYFHVNVILSNRISY